MPDIPDTMAATVIHRFGGPGELEFERVPVPSVDDDEILVRVHTAGVGVWDPFEREGKMKQQMKREPTFPYILGWDGAGTVAATGSAVDRFEEDDQVCAALWLDRKGGFYAEYAAVKADRAMALPKGLGLEEVGVLPIDGVTALRGLRDELDIQEGETVAVFGASGGIGHLAVQFANAMGAKVVAVASGTDGVTLANQIGADAAVDGHDDNVPDALARLAPNGLDAALLTASGEGLQPVLDGIAPGGRIAWPNGVRPEPEAPRGVEASSYNGTVDLEVLEEMNRLIESAPFVVHVDRTFPLEDAAAAHRAVEGHYRGKLALSIQS